jgi:hypothetical protein
LYRFRGSRIAPGELFVGNSRFGKGDSELLLNEHRFAFSSSAQTVARVQEAAVEA